MDPRNVKEYACSALAGADYNPKKLALLHTGAVVLFSLITTALSFLLDMGMKNAGGLSGIALRSGLESAQMILGLVGTIVLPFWQIGFLYAALGYNRKESVSPDTLLEGFRRFGPVLRLNILLILVAVGVSIVSTYVSSVIFMFSPFSDGMYEAMNNLLETTDATAITEEMLMEMIPHSGWLVVLNCAVLLAIGLPMYYRFRMSEFALLNGARGALAAMRESTWLARGRRIDMFKFDLSFWWYYALQLLIAAIAFGDTILAALGVTLPISNSVLYWILFGVHSVATLLFAWKYAPYYQTAYARYYDLLREVAPPIPDPNNQNKRIPE